MANLTKEQAGLETGVTSLQVDGKDIPVEGIQLADALTLFVPNDSYTFERSGDKLIARQPQSGTKGLI